MKRNTLFNYFSPKPENKSKETPIKTKENGSSKKESTTWQPGDLVWAKLEGYPWWPGMVTSHPSTQNHLMKSKGSTSIHIQFFDEPPSRAWIKELMVETFSGSDVLEFKKGGRYWTSDDTCQAGALQADAALKLGLTQRIEKYYQHLPSTDEENEEEDMEEDEEEGKENFETKIIVKTPTKSPRAKGRLPSRQATKRRRIIVEAGNDLSDSDDEFKPPKSDNDGSSDSASSGVDEDEEDSGSSEDSISDLATSDVDSPIKSRKRKRPMKTPRSTKVQGKRVNRKIDSDDAAEGSSDNSPPKEVRASPWARQADEAKSIATPTLNAKTKSRLSSFAAPADVSGPVKVEDGRTFPHVTLDFVQPDNIRDGEKRTKDHPEYNPRTLYVPPSFLDKQTPAMRQWWELKSKHYDCVLFFKMGKFYELFHMDAVIAVNELGLIYMKGEHAHSGFPEIAFGRYADTLIQKGHKVARIEQTETPDMMAERCKKMLKPCKYDKVVRREVCRVTTRGTRVYSFIDGDTTESEAVYLLALAEKEPIEGSGAGSTYGVCFVDTSIGEFYIGQFEDDRHCSRLRTLIANYMPAQVLEERGKLSERTRILLNNTLNSALRERLHSGTEFWDGSKTLRMLAEGQYFEQESTGDGDSDTNAAWPPVLQKMRADSDPLGHTATEDSDLALRALGAVTWYLRDSCLDHELLSLKKFTQYIPMDQQVENQTENIDKDKPAAAVGFTARQHMVLDGVTLANLDVVQNSSTGGSEGTLIERLDMCVTPFGKRLLRQWLCSPLCQPAAINDRLDAVEDLMEAQDAVSEASELLKKIPDLERLLSKIHTLGLAKRSKDHPDGRAIFFEDLTYSKRKIEDLLATLTGFKTAKQVIDNLKSAAKNFKSKLLRQTTLHEDEGRFPDLAEQLDFFEHAFDQQKAKSQGTITPNRGVDPEYDTAMADIKKTKRALDDYLEEQRDVLKCRTISYWGTAKNRFQLEVPDSAMKRVPNTYEVTSQKKGFRRFWTEEIKTLLSEMLDAEDRRDAALRDCLRRIFFAFDKNHTRWLAAVQCLAVLDVLMSLAQFSRCGDGVMCRPHIISPLADTLPTLEIREGRHPCISRTFSGGDFIPNDTVIGKADGDEEADEDSNATSRLVLVTGPNMGGKSTLMRQVGVIVILAQLGCYTPAEVCRLSPVDRVFTRLGASDRIMAGESTFFVELSETSAILQHATRHSLVLLDELGRGTATYDGTAIACAVVRELSESISCRTLFSTHYHSLVEEFSTDPNVRLGHMACMVENENEEDPSQETITFLYKFIGGACPKSYGFNAARLANIPEEVIKVAIRKAKEFESATNKIDWFRNLYKVDESKMNQLQSLHNLIEVS